MVDIVSKIKELKKYPRNNFLFLRRRIDTENGKTTMGWILSNKDLKTDIIDKNFDKLHNIMEEMVK